MSIPFEQRLAGLAHASHGVWWPSPADLPPPGNPPKVAVSNLLSSLKGVSSRLLRKERPDIEKRYWKGVRWSPSYFAASCGGAPVSIVRQYLEQQRTPY